MFLLKKIAGELLSPLPLILLVLAVALVLLWFTRRQRLGKLLATAGVLLLVVVAYGWLGGPALRSLEREFVPMAEPPAGIQWIVGISGGAYSDPDLPAAWRVTESTLARTIEGVRLYRKLPGAKLVLSGSDAEADTMAALAVELGVPRESIVADAVSPDTESQARLMRGLLKGERCVLVTSAVHMRRALALFRKAGVDALPAPTDYLSQSNAGLAAADFFPGPRRIRGADAAAHEYLGLAWGRLRGSL